MASFIPPAAQLDVIPTFGALVIGAWAGNIILGLNLCLVSRYFERFKKDRLVLKTMVGTLVVLDLLHTITYSEVAWWWTITNWGNIAKVDTIDWGWQMEIYVMGMVATIVQTFFAWRVHATSRLSISNQRANWFIPTLIILFSVNQLGWAISAGVFVARVKHPSKFTSYSWGVYIWYLSAAVGDFFITVSMFFYLLRAKNKTVFTNTQSRIKQLLILTLETNGITFVGAVIVPILFGTTLSKSLAFDGITCVHTKFYILSTLWTLNSRKDQENQSTVFTGSIPPPAAIRSTNLQADGLDDRFQVGHVTVTQAKSHLTEIELKPDYKYNDNGNADHKY